MPTPRRQQPVAQTDSRYENSLMGLRLPPPELWESVDGERSSVEPAAPRASRGSSREHISLAAIGRSCLG